MKKDRKSSILLNPVDEKLICIALFIIAGGIIAFFLGDLASIIKEEPKSEIHEEVEETQSKIHNEVEEFTESEVSWIYGEETGVSGLIPISCTRVKSLYTYTFYDPETGIMYYLVKDGNNSATASGSGVLENPDGTPRIYAPYQKDSGD